MVIKVKGISNDKKTFEVLDESFSNTFQINVTNDLKMATGYKDFHILVPVCSLYPHEKVDENIKDLYQLKDFLPIVVDQNTNIILDGHHRWTVYKLLEKTQIPVYYVDYMNSNILIGREDITKQDVINAALTNQLFPPKTTSHRYNINGSFIPLNTYYNDLERQT
jgi:hypothetical protein